LDDAGAMLEIGRSNFHGLIGLKVRGETGTLCPDPMMRGMSRRDLFRKCSHASSLRRVEIKLGGATAHEFLSQVRKEME